MRTRVFAEEIGNVRCAYHHMRSLALTVGCGRLLLICSLFALPGMLWLSVSMAMCPGEDESARSFAMNIAVSLEVYFVEHRQWPACLDELASPPEGKPVVERVPQDPWGNEYRYWVSGDECWEITVESRGPDERWGSKDDIIARRHR